MLKSPAKVAPAACRTSRASRPKMSRAPAMALLARPRMRGIWPGSPVRSRLMSSSGSDQITPSAS